MNEEMKTFMVPITIGGKYTKNILDKSGSIYIKAFAGLGIINAKDSQTIIGNINNPSIISQLKLLFPNLPKNFATLDQSDWNINETTNCFRFRLRTRD